MAMTERLYFTSPDPDFMFSDGARVAPNEGSFPTDAIVHVETETHFLEFTIAPKVDQPAEYMITLKDALPPLGETRDEALIVAGDILKKSQDFTLISQQSGIARQSFRAMRILANIEGLAVPVIDNRP